MTKKNHNSDESSDRNQNFFDKHSDEVIDKILARCKTDDKSYTRRVSAQNRSGPDNTKGGTSHDQSENDNKVIYRVHQYSYQGPRNKNWDEICKYKQPATVEEIQERLFAESNEDWVKKCLEVNYEECSEKNVTSRADAMRELIDRIAWFADHDEEKVIEVLGKNPIYDSWNGTDDYIRRKVSEFEEDRHYSTYKDK